MNVRVSANRAGGGTSPVDRYYRCLGDLLTLRLDDYGADVRSLAIGVYFPKPLRPGQTPSAVVAGAQAWLAKLPKATYRRSEHEIEISIRSEIEESRGGVSALEEVRRASNDVVLALSFLRKGRRNYGDFDVERFVENAERVLDDLPADFGEFTTLQDAARSKRAAAFAALDPWERLGIEWSKYAPNAKALLDDPFFWDEADGLSPHGSDTGADVLREFRSWNRKGPDAPLDEFLGRILKKWEMPAIDWSVDDRDRTLELHRANVLLLRACDEAAIAAAFAAIKVRGSCPPDAVDQARRAVLRRQIVAEHEAVSGDSLEASRRSTRLLVTALERLRTDRCDE